MSIETLLTQLIEALNANTAAQGGAATSSGETNAAEKPAAKAAAKPAAKAAPKGPTRDEMIAVLNEVKEKFGADEAKKLISGSGAKKMAEIADDKVKSVFDAATKKLAAPEAEEAAEDDGL